MSLSNNSIFLLKDDTVMGCGNNGIGILGTQTLIPKKIDIENVVHFFTGVDI